MTRRRATRPRLTRRRLTRRRLTHGRVPVVPIHDIWIDFGPEYHFRRIHLDPEGQELQMRNTAKGTSVTVPCLEVHSMVVGELEAAAQR